MKKSILFWAVLAITACISCINASGTLVNRTNDLAKTRKIENALKSTIGLYSKKRGRLFCTAFFVSPNLVATAKHCVTGEEFELFATIDKESSPGLIESFYFGNKFYGVKYEEHVKDQKKETGLKHFPMEIVYLNNKFEKSPRDTGDDIAILRVLNKKDWSKNWFSVATFDPNVGQKIYTIGMPMGLNWTIFEGSVSKHLFYKGTGIVRAYYSNIFVAPGSSGGPVFNHHGKVVGITSSGFFNSENPQGNLSTTMARYRLSQYIDIAERLIKRGKGKPDEGAPKNSSPIKQEEQTKKKDEQESPEAN